jgi:hypothetical protein
MFNDPRVASDSTRRNVCDKRSDMATVVQSWVSRSKLRGRALMMSAWCCNVEAVTPDESGCRCLEAAKCTKTKLVQELNGRNSAKILNIGSIRPRNSSCIRSCTSTHTRMLPISSSQAEVRDGPYHY